MKMTKILLALGIATSAITTTAIANEDLTMYKVANMLKQGKGNVCRTPTKRKNVTAVCYNNFVYLYNIKESVELHPELDDSGKKLACKCPPKKK